MTMKTYFITGVAGFIGSNTAETLLKQGHAVVGFDNLSPVYSTEKKYNNLDQVRGAATKEEQFRFVEGDLRDEGALKKALANQPVQVILHLAALAGVQPSIADPQSFFEVNVGGTLNVFEAAVKTKIHSIVFASSSSVYGNNKKLPLSETDPVDHPLSPYAASKKAGELMAYTYHYLHKLSLACMRFFTVYGPRQRPDLAIYKFCRAMLKGEPITLYGDGSSSRDYTFIEDCVDGILKAADWALAGNPQDPRYDIFNLGESQTVKLEELVALLEKNLSVKATKNYAAYLPGDVFATFADLEHSRDVLGYQPKTKIEEGLRRFCDWFVKEEKNKAWAK